MRNVIIGILLIVAGLSGKFTLLFTNSAIALVVFGVALTAWGAYQISNSRKQR